MRPLSALLSQVLVAFTVEFDNEFELRMGEAGYCNARSRGELTTLSGMGYEPRVRAVTRTQKKPGPSDPGYAKGGCPA